MWSRDQRDGKARLPAEVDPSIFERECRRAYFRVAAFLPIRLTPLAPEEIDAAVFDLSIPDPLLQPVAESADETPLMERLRRIEDKLDLLLGVSSVEVPSRLAGQDRQSVVFSGAGLALDVTWSFERGDAYKVEILLPAPYSRTVRAVGEAVDDAPDEIQGEGLRRLALDLKHMDDDERDALIAYSYDVQRFELRTRTDGEGKR